jgi:hypothetical protein
MVPAREQIRIHQEINARSRTNLDWISCIRSRIEGIVPIYDYRMSMYRIVVDITSQLK